MYIHICTNINTHTYEYIHTFFKFVLLIHYYCLDSFLFLLSISNSISLCLFHLVLMVVILPCYSSAIPSLSLNFISVLESILGYQFNLYFTILTTSILKAMYVSKTNIYANFSADKKITKKFYIGYKNNFSLKLELVRLFIVFF